MANVIKHKRGSGSDPAANNLVLGELAIRTDVGKLFTKMDSGAIAEIAGGGSDIAINTLSSSSATGGGSATFNGSAYRFTLSAPPSVSAQQLLVSINGVIQKPVAGTGQPSEGFSVDGTDIILGDAPATGADFFILTFKSLGVSEPADNSVTSAKIVDGAIVNADINASAAIAGTKISPNFGSQNIVTTGSITGNDLEIDSGTLSVDATNNRVGIGTTSPAADLSIFGNHVNQVELKIENTEGALRLRTNNNLGIYGANYHVIMNSDFSTQYIGIGGSGLDVTGDITISESIIHSGDTDTKISFPSNDTIRFDVAGSQTNYIQLDNSKTTFMRPIRVGDYVAHSGIDSIGVKFFNAGTGNNSTFVGLGAEDNGTSGGINHKTFRVFRQGSSVERMRIDSSGNVGIGDTSPDAPLVVRGPASAPHTVFRVNSQSESTKFSVQTVQDSDIRIGTQSNHPLAVYTNQLERMRIGSGGSHLFLGGSSSVNEITESSANTGMVIGNTSTGNGGLAIINSTSGTGRIYFGDSVGGNAARNRGQINYYHSSDYMMFATAGSERLRIDSSGNVTVKTTDVTFGGSGILRINSGSTSGALNLDGGSSNHGGEINLTGGSNGGRIQFRTGQGSGQQSEKMRLDENGKLVVGGANPSSSFGFTAGSLDVQGNDTTAFIDLGNPIPSHTNGTLPNLRLKSNCTSKTAEIQKIYGGDNNVYKHIEFNGRHTAIHDCYPGNAEIARFMQNGLTFNGDTAAANAISDYEEGSFTPRLGGSTNSSTYYVDGTGTYIKIGRKVTVSVRFNAVNLNDASSGNAKIFNMPFTAGLVPTNGVVAVSGDVQYYNVPFPTTSIANWYIVNSSTAWAGLVSRHNTTWIDFPASDFHSANVYINFSGTYFTAS